MKSFYCHKTLSENSFQERPFSIIEISIISIIHTNIIILKVIHHIDMGSENKIKNL